MNLFERRDVCEVIAITDEAPFRAFAATNPSGIAMIPEGYGESKSVVIKSDAGDFAKWLRQQTPSIPVALDAGIPRLSLHSADIWLPLVFLAQDVGLPLYIHLVGSYLFERMKGALRGDVAHVRLSAQYEDKKTKKVMRFDFEGDADSLQKVMKRFDPNKAIDD